MSGSNDAIELACNSFQKSVDNLIHKIQRRKQKYEEEDKSADAALERDCKRLVRHANHVLRTLTAKRTSLRHAITAFREVSTQCTDHFSTTLGIEDEGMEDRQRQILRRWFAIYLRLRDGFVLLESGERRHTRDGDDVDGGDVSKFQSKLSGAYRTDGRTRKFSSGELASFIIIALLDNPAYYFLIKYFVVTSYILLNDVCCCTENGYTGAGYDECYDDDVGVKRRLLDALAKMDGRRSRDALCEKLFDNDVSGAKFWENEMDGHINESKLLRDELNSIQQKFVDDINRHLRLQKNEKKGGGQPDKLKVVTDDKSERITLGLVDIARQGNTFTISDEGGSLPFGMAVDGWRRKFELVQSQPKSEKVKMAKKRKFILEDSSDEDGDNTKFIKPPPAQQVRKVQSKSQTTTKEDGNDGLAVRVREATDVGITKSNDGKKTTSIDEMKRQLGVNNVQLEQGLDQVEEEQLRSKMAADDEDMREGLLGDGGGGIGGGTNSLATHAPLLKACLSSRAGLRKDESYKNDIDLLRESEEYWAEFDNLLSQWKDHFQALLLMRKDVSKGSLDESSDHVSRSIVCSSIFVAP